MREITAALSEIPRADGAYFAWANDDNWGDSIIAPVPRGDVCRFVADLAGFAETYKVRAARCQGGARSMEGEAHDMADVL
eukprot:531682-Alexandrium_andersonii.AAC.1